VANIFNIPLEKEYITLIKKKTAKNGFDGILFSLQLPFFQRNQFKKNISRQVFQRKAKTTIKPKLRKNKVK